MKELSVIIPIYNGEKFIDQCMQNIQKCILENIEFIFINDGSTDSTEDKIQQYLYLDSRLKYFYQENKGVSSARNFGIQNSQGMYITFLDIDDYFDINLYSDLLCTMKKYKVDLVISSVMTHDGEKLGIKKLNLEGNRLYQIDEEFMSIFMLNEVNGSPWNKLYKSDILRNHEVLFDTEISIGEDYLFNLNYFIYTQSIYYINSSSYIYNIRPNSTMTSYNPKKFLNYENLHQKCLKVIEHYSSDFRIYQQLRYLIWVNNCFIDEVRLNQCKFVRKNNIKHIIENSLTNQVINEIKNQNINIGLKYKVIIMLLQLKYVFVIQLYVQMRAFLLRIKSICC